MIATAAHCVESISKGRSLYVFSRNSPASLHPHSILEMEVDAVNDLALLQLGSDSVRSLRAEWWNLSTASSRECRSGSVAYLVGFPAFRNLEHRVAAKRLTEMRPFSYFTNVTRRSLPDAQLSMGRRPDQELDIFTEISINRTMNDHDGGYFPAFEPAGLSGAGVFLVQGLREDALWSGHLSLAGIQCGHLRKSELLRASRIELVTQLAASHWS